MKTIQFMFTIISFIAFISCATIVKADLAITNVTIIDATGAPAQSGMTVLITNNRIVKIGKAQELKVADEVQLIDGSGKYLIPGLWDMHTHWYKKEYLPLFFANGVTGIRVMWGAPEHLQWRKESAEGKLLCPRMEIGTPIIDGPNPMWPGSIAISNAEEAQAAVHRFKDEGYDFIKVLNNLPREAFLAIAEECEKLEIPFAGHFPFTLSSAEAVETGLKSNEHLISILRFCSTQEEEFQEELTKLIAEKTPWMQMMPTWFGQRGQYLETFDQKKADLLFKQLAKHKSWQCPTLTCNRSMANLNNEDFKNDPRLRYMPPDISASWTKPKPIPPFITVILEKTFQKYLELIEPMNKAGIRFLAGTDVFNPFCFPGFSLHDELDLLVQSGLTPMEALQAATHNAAEYLGRLDSLGTIEEGKMADLVLLEANPLADIRNTQRINALVFDGKLFEKTDLQKMLQDIETLANIKPEK